MAGRDMVLLPGNSVRYEIPSRNDLSLGLGRRGTFFPGPPLPVPMSPMLPHRVSMQLQGGAFLRIRVDRCRVRQAERMAVPPDVVVVAPCQLRIANAMHTTLKRTIRACRAQSGVHGHRHFAYRRESSMERDSKRRGQQFALAPLAYYAKPACPPALVVVNDAA